MRFGKKVLIFISILIVILINISKTSYGYDDNKKNILILNSYSYESKWTYDENNGIKSILEDDSNSIDVEFMDTKIYNSEKYFEMLNQLYKLKYKDKKYNVIVATDNDAFEFMRKYGNDIFNNTPVVFCGVNNFSDDQLINHSNFTGVTENVNIKGTIDLGLSLSKNVNNIFVTTDNTITGIENYKATIAIQKLYPNIHFTYLNQLPIEKVISTINASKENSIAIILSDFKDSKEKFISFTDGTKRLSMNIEIPIYSCWNFSINGGVVGGVVLSGFDHGMEAGNLAKKIIKGISIFNIDVENNNNFRYMFDYNELKKFNINYKNLPKESIIINMPQNEYSISKHTLIYIFIISVIILVMIIIVLLLNINSRKKAEHELRENENLLLTLVNSSPDTIFYKNSEGLWKAANEALINLLGISSKDYLNKTNKDLAEKIKWFEEISQRDTERDLKVREEGKSLRYEFQFDIKGKTLNFDVFKVPIYNVDDNSYKGVLTIGRDITENKQAEEDKKTLNEIKEYDKLKTEFFANISHELRTPLNVIFSALQVIQLYEKQTINKEAINKIYYYTDVMKQNCYRLVRIVNNLIDITKIDAGYIKTQLSNGDIVNTIEDITLSVKDYVELKGIQLIFDTDIEEKYMAYDEDKIERIMLNLLSNAVKFTESGGTIKVSIYDKENHIVISVKDNGIGIPKDKQTTVFERFIQVDKSLSRNTEGSGIGLSLVKSLVEMHSGTIKIISDTNNLENRGSEFLIELPTYLLNDEIAATEDTKIDQSNRIEKINIEFSDIYL